MTQPIYLDYQATTPLDPRVLSAMMPFFTEKFGNPHSSTHKYGWETEAALDISREQVAAVIGGKPADIVFLSGATEANNLAIKGVMASRGHKRPHIVTVITEHKCVLESVSYCKRHGFQLTVLPVKKNGILDLNLLESAVTNQTALVSVMAVNNEIGVIQPLAEIGEIAHRNGALFHTDAAQAFGKIPLNVIDMHIDLMSISGHKTYGPKGIGALFYNPDEVKGLVAQMSGGGQEGGIRPGTQAPALVAGMGMAASLAHKEMAEEQSRLAHMMDRFSSNLYSNLPDLQVNGDLKERWIGNLNLSFLGLDAALLLTELRGLALSSGAACASSVAEPSYVLEAIGLSKRAASSTLRFGVGRFTTDDELEKSADMIIRAVEKLGGLRPE